MKATEEVTDNAWEDPELILGKIKLSLNWIPFMDWVMGLVTQAAGQ